MGLSKLFLSGRILQRGGLRTVGSRALTTSDSKAQGPCADDRQAKVLEGRRGSGTEGVGSQTSGQNKTCAVVGVYTKDGAYKLSGEGRKLDESSQGKITKALKELPKQMEVGTAFVVTDVGKYSAVALAGYGPYEVGYSEPESLEEKRENERWGVGAGVRVLKGRCGVIEIDPGAFEHDATAEAAMLATWQFDKFKSTEQPKIVVKEMSDYPGQCEWDIGIIRGRAQNWARFLSDMPASKMTPIDLAQEAVDVLCPLGVKVVAHDRAWIEAQGMEAFLTVARGSCEEPVFLECEWKKGGGPTVLVAAKGVTFDCGGLCLKKHEHMMENRGSMAGAAAALGAMRAIAELNVELNVAMVIPLCENMISGQCMKVGDVVKALNGLSILIEDTDMEGRLMLADALVYGQAAHAPETVIDVATLTHGIQLATAGGAFGAFSNDEKLWECVRQAGSNTGDRPWRFPLWDYYHRRVINDPSVDLRNRGSGKASPCLGAAFLKNFVCCDKWLHMDTTGVGKLAHAAPPYLSPGRMTGRPTRTLARLLGILAELKDIKT